MFIPILNIDTDCALFDYFIDCYKYLDSSEHNECWPNTDKENELYKSMWNSFVTPIIASWEKKHNTTWPPDAYFDFFCTSDDSEGLIVALQTDDTIEIVVKREDNFDEAELFILTQGQIGLL